MPAVKLASPGVAHQRRSCATTHALGRCGAVRCGLEADGRGSFIDFRSNFWEPAIEELERVAPCNHPQTEVLRWSTI